MKVKFEKKDKKYITIAEAPLVHEIIADMKEDEYTAADWAEYAVAAAYNHRAYSIEILKASAKIAKNGRVWNVLNDHSETLDVWIEATAYVNGDGFIIIGSYLSDIWQINADNTQESISNMYIRKFTEDK